VKTAAQMEKGRIARMRPFPCAMPRVSGDDAINGNWNGMTPTNGDDKDVRTLNRYLIDPSGTAFHVGCERMT
jgi:hypothetical protein